MGRKSPSRVQLLNGGFQYIQDKQEVTLNDRFGVHIGPSGDFSDIQTGMSEIRIKSDHPQVPLDVSDAAKVTVHVQQSVLTLSVRTRPFSQGKTATQRSPVMIGL